LAALDFRGARKAELDTMRMANTENFIEGHMFTEWVLARLLLLSRSNWISPKASSAMS